MKLEVLKNAQINVNKKEPTMTHHLGRITGMLLLVAVLGAACSSASGYVYVDPASVEEVDAGLWRITLTEQAAARTGVETVEVAMENVGGTDRLVLPYSAIMYHFDGTTWTYANPEPLIYQREAIEIDFIEGDTVVLNSGPPVGTTVVSVGAAELYGVEFGIGK